MSVRIVTPTQEADLIRKAFDNVCDENDWKGPIDCIVPWDTANVYTQAIEFMTGVKPTCTREMAQGVAVAHLRCIGYRAGPCGG